jgi:hypothetical protein
MNLRQARADGAIAVLAVGVPGDSDGVARIVRIPRRLDTLNTFPGSISTGSPNGTATSDTIASSRTTISEIPRGMP